MHFRTALLLVATLVCLVGSLNGPASAVTVDWRTKNVLTAVEDQGSGDCNLSWAFAVSTQIATEITLAMGVLNDLSEQQLIDCSGAAHANQCACPQLSETFAFVAANGVCTDAAYPFTGQPGTCSTSCTASPFTLAARPVVLPVTTEADLISALNARPVIARLEVGAHGQPLPGYLSYSGGVFAPTEWDASVVQWVVIVGYTDTELIVRNSLGTGWGDGGYMHLARGGNRLGVQNFVYGVILGGSDPAPLATAPCTPGPTAPLLSPLALAALVTVLGAVSLRTLRRARA